MTNAQPTIAQVNANPWKRVDKRIATLELLGADITAILSKTRIKQYSTYSISDMEAITQVVEADKLIPSVSI